MSGTLSIAGIFLRFALCRTSRIGLRPQMSCRIPWLNTHEISGLGAARASKRQGSQPQFNFSSVDARKEVISPARQDPFAQVAFVCQLRGVALPNGIGFEGDSL